MTDMLRTTRVVTEFDVDLINSKLQLLQKLKEADIDYDHYRGGERPPGRSHFKESDAMISGLPSDISPCDFADFESKLLIKYTKGRQNINSQIPQFYHPEEKERRSFEYYMKVIMPQNLAMTSPTDISTFNDKDYYLPYEKILLRYSR